jgi:short-subunit dehydrogenase
MSVEILANKKVLVIGASGGIGGEAARLIKSSQAVVFIAGRNREKLEQLAGEANIPAENIFVMDITQPTEVERAAKPSMSASAL